MSLYSIHMMYIVFLYSTNIMYQHTLGLLMLMNLRRLTFLRLTFLYISGGFHVRATW